MTYEEALEYFTRCVIQQAIDPWWHAKVALFYRMKLDVARLIIAREEGRSL